jgi:hypothetical protein
MLRWDAPPGPCGRQPAPVRELAPHSAQQEDQRIDPALRCRACGLPITSHQERIEMLERHEHVFFNPHGHVFEIGCFQHAPGCSLFGPPQTEFSWFPGHSWQIAICGSCQTHLGWHFLGHQGGDFFGLILQRLTESPRQAG